MLVSNRRRPMFRFSCALAVATALILTGCANASHTTAATDVAAREYFFKLVDQARRSPQSDALIAGDSLASTLPNRTYVAETQQGKVVEYTNSDLLVVGRVVNVTEGEAWNHTGEDRYEIVDFYSPEADERSVMVTVDVSRAYGQDPMPRSIEFRMGLLGSNDPPTFIKGLASLGDVAIVLSRVDDGRSEGTLIPGMSGALVGTIDASGELDFPGLGTDEERFLDGVNTVDELSAEAEHGQTVQSH